MKLIIISDTHIKPGQSLLAHLPEDLISILKSSDIIIHAGDFETLGCYNELKNLGKLIAVHGNADADALAGILKRCRAI